MDIDWKAAFVDAGLTASDDQVALEPLAGGVSSDIFLVRSGTNRFCVKRALARLKVAADWRAPVERNRSEVEWLKLADEVVPGAAPRILADRSSDGWFAMEYLEPTAHPVWKAQLRDGQVDPDFAARVGRLVVRIHAATAGDAEVARRFATDHIFYPIRLEAYLLATADRHAELAGALTEIFDLLRGNTHACSPLTDAAVCTAIIKPRGRSPLEYSLLAFILVSCGTLVFSTSAGGFRLTPLGFGLLNLHHIGHRLFDYDLAISIGM